MEKTIKASLILIGRDVPWLANVLRVSKALIYRRFKDEEWTLPQLRKMKELFSWETLEG